MIDTIHAGRFEIPVLYEDNHLLAVVKPPNLPTQADQERALRNLREQLLPGGILTLNTFDPWPPMQARQMQTTPEDYSFRLEYVNRAGNREKL